MNPATIQHLSGHRPAYLTPQQRLALAVSDVEGQNLMPLAGMAYVHPMTGRPLDGSEAALDSVNVLLQVPAMHGNRTITKVTRSEP